MSPEIISDSSPELRDQHIYSYKTDCWSLGCVLFELITLEVFFDKNLKTNEAITKDIDRINTLNGLFKQLIKRMLQIKKEERASSQELRSMLELFINI